MVALKTHVALNHGVLSHLGIQVDSTEMVKQAIERFQVAGLATFEEQDTDCCYALQNKVWVTDPDGNRWEIFVIKIADTTPEQNVGLGNAPVHEQPVKPCCA